MLSSKNAKAIVQDSDIKGEYLITFNATFDPLDFEVEITTS